MNNCKYCKQDFIPHKLHPKSSRCSSKNCIQAYKNEWGKLNPKCKQKWILKNPEKRKQASENYRKKNKEYYREYASLRSRKTTQAKPKWLNEFDQFWLSEIYHLAILRNLEVDHIVPITNKQVCGLHVPWNLQLLTRQQNAQKSNKFDEDVVGVVTNG